MADLSYLQSPSLKISEEDGVPSYLQGADAHNQGNQSDSWFDPTTWQGRASNGLKFAAASIISGGAQLYNSGVSIGKLAGITDSEGVAISDVVSSIDSDLGSYYDANRQSTDLAGFLVSSLVPGIRGVKILNAGQKALTIALAEGRLGANMSRATSLLVPKTEAYITAAAHDINAATATFSAISQNGIKALASGVVQNTLEAAAFETMVQASMFSSPVLKDQDFGDIVHNIALGGAVGGVIGGAISGVTSYYGINKLAKLFERDNKANSARILQQEVNSPALNVIRNAADREETLKAGVLNKLPENATADQVSQLKLVNETNFKDKLQRIKLAERSDVNAMAHKGELDVTNMVADITTNASSKEVVETFLHTEAISRAGITTRLEEVSNKISAGKELSTAEKTLLQKGDISTSYAKLTGESAGTIYDSAPAILSIADKVELKVGVNLKDAILARVKDYKYKVSELWDAAKQTGSAGHTNAEARYIWARNVELPEIASKTPFTIHKNDIPMLERAWDEMRLDVKLADSSGAIHQEGFSSLTAMKDYIISVKEDVASGLVLGKELSESVAKIVNTKLSRLDKSRMGQEESDYFAHQAATKEHIELKTSKGLPKAAEFDSLYSPTYAKISRQTPADAFNSNGHLLDGMTWVKGQEARFQMAMDNVVASITGPLNKDIISIPEKALMQSNKSGSGARMFSFGNGGYGTLDSMMQSLGSITQKLQQQFRTVTKEAFEPTLVSLGKKQEAVIEFHGINQKVTRSAKQWVMDSEDLVGGNGLISKEAKDRIAKLQKAGDEEGLDEYIASIKLNQADYIPITHTETRDVISSMLERSGARTDSYKALRSAQGLEDAKDPAVYRPLRPNPKDYKHFAFVTNPKVTGQGHTTMIFANDAESLAKLRTRVEQEGFSVHYKSALEEYKKAYGDYEYSRTINESYLDSTLKNKGIFSEHFVQTDSQKTINDILNQHLREDDVLAMEVMRAKNQKAFDFLEDQGKAYSQVESSTLGGPSVARIESSGKNPYVDYIKTALNISKISEHPVWQGFNKGLDEVVSKAVGSIKTQFAAARTPAELEVINASLQKFGMDTAYRDAALDLLVNHPAPKGELTKFVRTANAILSRFTLGLDPMNALNNAIGANVLRGTELTQITKAIKAGNKELAGELGELGKIGIPGTELEILAPGKLIDRAIRSYWKEPKDGELFKSFRDSGFIKDATTQFKDIVDDFTLKGTEIVGELNSRKGRAFAKAKALGEAGEKLTGNALTEDFNRFISAHVMKDITDLAQKYNLLSPAESHSYINTFVNRVEGNTIATQRPLAFQGPIGQAIGLFQSYQFNMMQQLFRYIGEGTAKDSAMLLGLQGTFYGLNGLPGFQLINTHIVGNFSGNAKHVDLYDSTYGAAGKQAGNLIMYGLPSNLLQANLYSRGDINPRQVTLLPTTLPDVPFIGAYGKFIGNLYDMAGKIGGGGNVQESLLQGIEHNGISRPLAGLAQTLQGLGNGGKPYSTTSQGSILFSNDLASLATLTRLAGARPLEESIVNDGVFRISSYQQLDRQKQLKLAETMKSTFIQGNTPDEDQVIKFARQYAENGGKQINFNKFMMNELKSTNTNAAQKITQQLQNPFAQKIQVLMGGDSPSNY